MPRHHLARGSPAARAFMAHLRSLRRGGVGGGRIHRRGHRRHHHM
jgi:hypothetical protein